MTVALEPRRLPEWTAFLGSATPPRAMYPLGIDAATQNLESRLFDGITSQTPFVGYYAFYAWALTRFRERMQEKSPQMGASDFAKAEKRWVARLEAVLRAATLVVNPDVRGMFGANAARADGALPKTGVLSLSRQPAYRTTGVNFYIGPLSYLGCGGRREGFRGEYRAGSGSAALAEAMEDACESQPGGKSALQRLMKAAGDNSTSIAVADVRTLAPALALGRVSPGSSLHRTLVRTLFAHEGPTKAQRGSSGWARSEALAVCLDLARQAGGAVDGRPIEVIRRAILTRYLDRGHRVTASPLYSGTFAALRRLYERHFLQLALYGLWRDVIVSLQESPSGALSLQRITEIISGHVRGATAASAKSLGRQPLDTAVKSLLRRAAKRRVRRKRSPWRSDEENLALEVAAGTTPRAGSVAAPALALLVRLVEGWLHRTEYGQRRVKYERWHSIGGRDRLALSVVCADLRRRQDLTGQAYLSWVLDAYVIGQSLRATVAKGPQSRSGEYVYFIVPDSGGYRINHPSRLSSYLVVDSPRLRYALNMLEQLDLITREPRLDITRHGEALLRKLERFHSDVPSEQETDGE